MRDLEMHTMAGLGAIALALGLALPTVWFSDARGDTRPPLEDMEAIEASVAFKKPNAPKQPQKPKSEPTPEVKPEGVSRDEHKQPEDKPAKPDVKPSDNTDPLAKYKRNQDDEEPGKPDDKIGAFDGSDFGVGDVTKGDPYFQRLIVDLAWSSPELAKAGAEAPVGCIQLTADGKIPQTTFKVKGDDDIATLAESALRDLQKLRNAKPEEVPVHLLKQLTTRWICFKFTVKAS